MATAQDQRAVLEARLKVGSRFASFEEFENVVKAYSMETHAVFTANDCKRGDPGSPFSFKYFKLGCKHYGSLRVQSKGIRPNQKSFKSGCPVFVGAKVFENVIAISNVHLEHNHDCSEDIVKYYPERRRLNDAEKDKVEALIVNKVSPALLQSYIRNVTGKSINIQDVANLRYSIRKKKSGGKSEMEQALAVLCKILMEDPQASVIIGKQPPQAHDPLVLINLREILEREQAESVEDAGSTDHCNEMADAGDLEFIYVQFGSMKKTFLEFPEILLMDNTYNICNNRMPLNVMENVDGNGCGRVTSYTFLCNERKSTMSAILKCLAATNVQAVEGVNCVSVDKNLSEIDAVREVFGSEVYISLFNRLYYRAQ